MSSRRRPGPYKDSVWSNQNLPIDKKNLTTEVSEATEVSQSRQNPVFFSVISVSSVVKEREFGVSR